MKIRLLREELAKKIAELEKIVSDNKKELDNKIENNKTFILNLTNKENSNNVFLKTYPIGSIYISTSGTNPSVIYGKLNIHHNNLQPYITVYMWKRIS